MSDDPKPNSFFIVGSIYDRNNLTNVNLGDITCIGDELYTNVTGSNGCDDDWKKVHQPRLPDMRYDPATGLKSTTIRTVNMYRINHQQRAWLFNPWTGASRTPDAIGLDPYGYTVSPPLVIETEEASILITTK
jgi:hypothetical protein